MTPSVTLVPATVVADHPGAALLAIPAVLPAVIVAVVILVIMWRDRREERHEQGDDEE